MMKISSVQTNFYGTLPYIREISVDEWSDKYLKPVKTLLSSLKIIEARVSACRWIAHLKTNDEHIYKCFSENFDKTDSDTKPELFLYALTNISDRHFLKIFHDANNEKAFIERISKTLAMREYTEGLRDKDLLEFKRLPLQRKYDIALSIPSAMYVPDLNLFLLINTNSYKVFRDQGIFGSIKKIALSKISVGKKGAITNIENTFLPLNASATTLKGKSTDHSIAFLSADSAIKTSLAVSFVEQYPEASFLSSSQVYINPETMKILPVEKTPFVAGKTISENPSVFKSAQKYEFENVSDEKPQGTASSIFNIGEEVIQDNLFDPITKSLINRSAFGMFNPSECWGKAKTASSGTLKTLILVKLNYGDFQIIRNITAEESIEILTSRDNFDVYDESDIWASEFNKLYSMTVLWFDTTSITTEEKSDLRDIQGVLMREILKKDLRIILLNPLLPSRQSALLVQKFLNEPINTIELISTPSAVLCAKLRILRKTEKRDEGIASHFVISDGTEVKVLGFHCGSSPSYYATFDSSPHSRHFVKSYSRGSVSDFFSPQAESNKQKVV